MTEPLIWHIAVPDAIPSELQVMVAIHRLLLDHTVTKGERQRILAWINDVIGEHDDVPF